MGSKKRETVASVDIAHLLFADSIKLLTSVAHSDNRAAGSSSKIISRASAKTCAIKSAAESFW